MINPVLEKEAKESLKSFIRDTYDLLKDLVYEGIDAQGRPFFIEDLIDDIHAGWEEFHKDFNLNNAAELIEKTKGETLQSSGLYGRQLKLKLSVVKKWKERFSQRRLKKILLKLLDAIDTLLDSLITATRIDIALKEIKDILRNSIEED